PRLRPRAAGLRRGRRPGRGRARRTRSAHLRPWLLRGRLDRCRPGAGPRADRGRRRQAGTSAAPPGRVPGLPRLVGDRQTALVRPRTALIARLRSSRAVLSVVRGVVAWLVRRTSAAVESFLFDEFLEFGLEVAHLV